MEKCIKVFFVGTRVCAFICVYRANDVMSVGTNEKIQDWLGFFSWGTGDSESLPALRTVQASGFKLTKCLNEKQKDHAGCCSSRGVRGKRRDSNRFLNFALQNLESGFSEPCVSAKKREQHNVLLSLFGWGAGIRTPEMSESESDALPLGDTPIFSTLCIIAEKMRVVNTYFKLF